jgi:hypothetical protein
MIINPFLRQRRSFATQVDALARSRHELQNQGTTVPYRVLVNRVDRVQSPEARDRYACVSMIDSESESDRNFGNSL